MRRASEIGGAALVLSRQIDALHSDLLAFAAKTERWFDRIDRRFDRVERQFDRFDQTLDRLDLKVEHTGGGVNAGLRRIVADAVCQVLREHEKKH